MATASNQQATPTAEQPQNHRNRRRRRGPPSSDSVAERQTSSDMLDTSTSSPSPSSSTTQTPSQRGRDRKVERLNPDAPTFQPANIGQPAYTPVITYGPPNDRTGGGEGGQNRNNRRAPRSRGSNPAGQGPNSTLTNASSNNSRGNPRRQPAHDHQRNRMNVQMNQQSRFGESSQSQGVSSGYGGPGRRQAGSASRRNVVAATAGPDYDDLAESLGVSLTDGSYECMVCYDKVRPSHKIWACHDCCHAVFHIK
ncbi:hypothetical protein HDU67_000799, partial [Dinochytrium kinnereticum]